MAVPFKINVTKEILNKSKFCGMNESKSIGDNCAIAVSIQHLFPNAFVTGNHIYPFGVYEKALEDLKIRLPKIAQDFIKIFDSLSAIPKVRVLLPEFEFEIEISDEIISKINIDVATAIVENVPLFEKHQPTIATEANVNG
jgi:hypothetical protein